MPATKPTAAHEVKVEDGAVFVQLRNAAQVEASATTSTPAAPAAPTLPLNPVASTPAAQPSTAAVVPTPDTTSAAPSTPTVEHTGPVNEDSCREALKQVIDPELFINIVDLGLIYLVQVAEKDEGKSDVTIEMTMTSPACPAGPQLLHN
ncbi:MAG: DUF59 domain-containing protein, partial [Planctomycetaceae bacterium]|nr:DUF59 domain-containing protein [Planctomycetaceae bacterium]